MPRTVPARVPFLLFFLFFLGLALNVLLFVDLNWTHWVLNREVVVDDGAVTEPMATEPMVSSSVTVSPTPEVERLRQSILNLRVTQCSAQRENTGTAFVVKAGYVATAAHIFGDQQTCGGRIRLIDWRGREHTATLAGLSTADDLALLQISDTSLPPLLLADSSAYESPGEVVTLVTIGYPLEQAGGSSQDSSAISGQGNLSRFDRSNNIFVTSGLNLNPGNSGGPIFVRPSWQVLGVASAKLRNEVGEGIAYVVPIRTFETFFRDKTGEALR